MNHEDSERIERLRSAFAAVSGAPANAGHHQGPQPIGEIIPAVLDEIRTTAGALDTGPDVGDIIGRKTERRTRSA